MSQTLKIVLAVILTTIVVGGGVYYWQNSRQTTEPDIITKQQLEQTTLQTYSSPKYSFKYAKEYKISEEGKDNTYILTVSKNSTSKLEIFDASKYPVDRAAFGFSGEETPEEAEAYIKEVKAKSAKEYLKTGSYDVWLYYNENDNKTKEELKAIFSSIVVK